MSRSSDARSHLVKAREFLEAAELAKDHGYHNAACSLAVTSSIQSKDAVCTFLIGRSDKSDDHNQAVAELRRAGKQASAMADTLSKVLRLKPKSQYLGASVSANDAEQAVKRASRLHADAQEILSS